MGVTHLLRNFYRSEIMDSNKTLRENGVPKDEVFIFLIEIDDKKYRSE